MMVRSATDRMIGGVCGGLARYLQIEVTWVRLFFILLALGDGAGVLIYLILWLVMPNEQRSYSTLAENVSAGANEMSERAREMGQDVREAATRPNQNAGMLIGGVLIFLGTLWLIEALNFPWLRWLRVDNLWPVLLIVAGVVLLVRRPAQLS